MKSIKEVREFLGGSDFKFQWPIFNKANIENEHKINEAAKGLALRGQPTPESEDLSNVEQEVISDCKEAYKAMVDKAKSVFKEAEDSVNALIGKIHGDSTEKALEDCKQKHNREIQGYHKKIEEKRVKVKIEEGFYEKFKLKNDIIREAQPYTPTSFLITTSIVLGLLILEIAVNTGLVGLQAEGVFKRGYLHQLQLLF